MEAEKLVELIPLHEDQPFMDKASGEICLFYTVVPAFPEAGYIAEIASLSRYTTDIKLNIPNHSKATVENAIQKYLQQNDLRFIK